MNISVSFENVVIFKQVGIREKSKLLARQIHQDEI
jgi:hypothetical protein